jgi:hypothetical protein
MDFITKVPIRAKKYDFIMVVVNTLTKEAHFVPIKLTHKEVNIAEIYMKELAMMHDVPKAIVYDIYP